MEGDYPIKCYKCFLPFDASREPYGGICGHSICEKCTNSDKNTKCPYSNCKNCMHPFKQNLLQLINDEMEQIRAQDNEIYKILGPNMLQQVLHPATPLKNSSTIVNKPLNTSNQNMQTAIGQYKKMTPSYGVYVGNLPTGLKDLTLANYFSICGQITSAKVTEYYNNDDDNGAYGFVYFTNPADQEKALLFTKKQLGIHIITVLRAKGGCFKTFVEGILPAKSREQIKNDLDHYFPGKYSPSFSYDQAKGTLMVAFHDDESRQEYIQMKGIVSERQAVIQEPTKVFNSVKIPENGRYNIYLRNIPYGTTRETIEQLFVLCGPMSTVNVSNEDNKFITGQITFSTDTGLDTALKFNLSNVNGWTLPIIVTTEYINPRNLWVSCHHFKDLERQCRRTEYPFTATIRRYDQNLKLWEIEEKICKTIGNVHVLRCKSPLKPGARPYLFANFKIEEERDELLDQDNKINLGGPGLAIIHLSDSNKRNISRFSSMESLNSVYNGAYNMIRNSSQHHQYQRANLPSLLFQTQPATFKNKCSITVCVERKIDEPTLRQLFNRMITIKKITEVGNSYHIESEIEM